METGRKLLLADDSVTIQKVVDLTFADEGMQVTTVSDGEQAIQKLEEVTPDIVLADVFMPKRNGYEVCEHIKRNERFRHIPVMLLVGSFEPFDETEARRVGADDFLTKPFQSIRQLVNKVGALLGGETTEGELPTQKLFPPSAAAQAGAETGALDLELSTADTAPLSHPPQPETAEAQITPHEAASANGDMDDRTVETAPVSEFGVVTPSSESQAEVAAPPDIAEMEEAQYQSPSVSAPDQLRDETLEFTVEETDEEATAEQPLPTTYMSNATAADEPLLDLDEVVPSPASIEGEDAILDIEYEAYAPPAVEPPADGLDATLSSFGAEMTEAAPRAREFVEAQIVGDEQRAKFAPASEPQAAESRAGAIRLDQLSPEVIDAIARRAVEQLSERVVQEIAWEVVPQLAELLIKRRLEEERTQAR